MNLQEQKKIQKHFERMWQDGEKPWIDIGMEPDLDQFFKLLSHKYPRAKILDIGCGNGWISIRAAKEGHEVWGIDSSETAIKEAITVAKTKGVDKTTHFQVGDALNLSYEDNSFDALIDRGLFHHIIADNRPLYFQNILRVLKPKSLMYLHVFSTKNPSTNGELFTEELVKEVFAPHFTILASSAEPYRLPVCPQLSLESRMLKQTHILVATVAFPQKGQANIFSKPDIQGLYHLSQSLEGRGLFHPLTNPLSTEPLILKGRRNALLRPLSSPHLL